MTGSQKQQDSPFSYVPLEKRIPKNHPLRPIRKMVEKALEQMSEKFSELYSHTGRPSIAPE